MSNEDTADLSLASVASENASLQSVDRASRKRLPQSVRLLLFLLTLFALSYWLYLRFTHVYSDDARIAANMITISSQAAGQVVELRVRQGDTVAKDAVIAVIDDN